MLLQTPVELPPRGPQLSPQSSVLLLGSCFAAHIGERLSAALNAEAPAPLRCASNPFGVLYNPRSICQALRLLMMPQAEMQQHIEASLFRGRDGGWHSWLFSTLFSATSREETLLRTMQSATSARSLLSNPDLCIILTFGTDHHYALAARHGCIVANCHKEHPDTFIEQTDAVAALQALLVATLQEMAEHFPHARFILTVSPYRYRKYGFHTSMVGKARLLLMCEAAQAALPQCVSYFPAYEILNDELRDYRFYQPDMLHPSAQAVDYIAARFEEWCFLPALTALAAERRKAMRSAKHREILQPSE